MLRWQEVQALGKGLQGHSCLSRTHTRSVLASHENHRLAVAEKVHWRLGETPQWAEHVQW